jgi:hypothetical protein
MEDIFMRRYRFTFVCSQDERVLISALADHHKRSQSDTLRLLVLAAARDLNIDASTLVQDSIRRRAVSNAK